MTAELEQLNRTLIEAFARDGAPVVPPPVAARIKRRVLAGVGRPQSIDIARDEGWQRLSDKAEIKILFDDGQSRSWLVRLAPGGALPPHRHDDGPEECIIVEGEVETDGVVYRAGDYSVALRGSEHRSIVSHSGCVFFFRSPSPPQRLHGG